MPLAVRRTDATCSGPSDCTLSNRVPQLARQLQRKSFAHKHARAADRQQHIAFAGRVHLLAVVLLDPSSARTSSEYFRGNCPAYTRRNDRAESSFFHFESYSSPIDAVELFVLRRHRRLPLRRIVDPAIPLRRQRIGNLLAAKKLASEYAHRTRPSRPRRTARSPHRSADEYPASAAPAPAHAPCTAPDA